jgi:hypothetical protein
LTEVRWTGFVAGSLEAGLVFETDLMAFEAGSFAGLVGFGTVAGLVDFETEEGLAFFSRSSSPGSTGSARFGVEAKSCFGGMSDSDSDSDSDSESPGE